VRPSFFPLWQQAGKPVPRQAVSVNTGRQSEARMAGQGKLVLATFNAGKVAEFRQLLAALRLELASLADMGSQQPLAEGGHSLADNARQKATAWARRLGQWALGDDTGLEVEALGGAPGIHTARFAGPGATPEANRRRLLEQLAGVRLEDRRAQFVCHLALADPSGTVRAESRGRCRGRIRLEEAGQRGFGYDCLFEIIEYHRTLAELGPAARQLLSHRARALQQLLPRLAELMHSGQWAAAVESPRRK